MMVHHARGARTKERVRPRLGYQPAFGAGSRPPVRRREHAKSAMAAPSLDEGRKGNDGGGGKDEPLLVHPQRTIACGGTERR